MWLLRIPEILELLEQLDSPVIDRASCERLFAVSRRTAINLLQGFGGYQVGRTYVVDRADLMNRLRSLVREPVFTREYHRKRKLAAQLDELHHHRAAAQVRIPVPCTECTRMPDLPEGVSLKPGVFSVSYATTEQLLSRLYAVAQTAASDFDRFCAVVESPPISGGAPGGETAAKS
jgi:hypothetical protein